MSAPSIPEVQTVRAVRTSASVIATIAHVCIILFSVGFVVRAILDGVARAATSAVRAPEVGEIEEHASTNAVAAHITFTNLNSFPAETCIRGVVQVKGQLNANTASAPVCTGEMKPRTTIVLEAPYKVGAVEELCSGAPDRFGNTHLDWSKCEFTTEKVAR